MALPMTGVARLGDAVDMWGNGVLGPRGPPWALGASGALGESGEEAEAEAALIDDQGTHDRRLMFRSWEKPAWW